jgi:hypothetical protein
MAAQLSNRVKRLERSMIDLLPDQKDCAACHGAALLVFPDEAVDIPPPIPYDGPGGTCRWCRRPPPGVRVITLAPDQRRAFAAIPWSQDPRERFREKLSLILTVWRRTAEGEALAVLNRLSEKVRLDPVDEQLVRLFERAQTREATTCQT